MPSHVEFPVDPSGDLFGNYNDCEGAGFVMETELAPSGMERMDRDFDDVEGNPMEVFDEVGNEGEEDEEEGDEEEKGDEEEEEEEEEESEGDLSDVVDAVNAEQENGLEPERPDYSPTSNSLVPSETPNPGPSRIGRGEDDLAQKPYIVEFPGGNAGCAYNHNSSLNTNNLYANRLQAEDSDNIYMPWSSKLEWEVTHWAKL